MNYTISHPMEARDFVMFSYMTCDCPLVWLRLGFAFESVTPKNLEARWGGKRGRHVHCIIVKMLIKDQTFL